MSGGGGGGCLHSSRPLAFAFCAEEQGSQQLAKKLACYAYWLETGGVQKVLVKRQKIDREHAHIQRKELVGQMQDRELSGPDSYWSSRMEIEFGLKGTQKCQHVYLLSSIGSNRQIHQPFMMMLLERFVNAMLAISKASMRWQC